ncbi:exosome complex protein Rrp42 [Candidatus Pacearchaeota archaeon]|nr:exosome complex protein Rrp42 [Candidatus Pacearchaeota archaeon]
MNLPNINKKRIESLLSQDKRLDERKLFDYRDIIIETGISGNAEGSARVRIGKTEVIVGVKLGTQTPYTDHEDEGTMITGMEFSPMCGERYEGGPPKINAIETARVVDRGIRESGFIDWKKLCIKEGETVWSVAIDIYCVNDDGNVLDASSIGAVAALMMTRFPVYDEKEEKVKFGEWTNDPLPLTEKVPFAMTIYKVGDKLLADPNREEEDAAKARVTLAISKPGKEYMINSMQKGELDTINGEDLKKILEESEKIYDKIFPELDKQIKSLQK